MDPAFNFFMKTSVSRDETEPALFQEGAAEPSRAGLHLITFDSFILSVTGCRVWCEVLFPNVVQGPQGHLVLGSAVKRL